MALTTPLRMRTAQRKISDTVLSLDAMPEDDVKSAAWLADSRDCMEELITALKEKELLSILTEKQRELYLAMTREGLTLREFARRKGIGIRAAFDLKAAVQKKFQRNFLSGTQQTAKRCPL